MDSPLVYWPFVLYALAVVGIVTGMLVVSNFLGTRHSERATGEPYEGGITPTGTARLRFSVKFYLIAILFVIFDLEVVYIFSWAVAIHELGWTGYIGVLVFIGILIIGLIYEWRMGSLDWGMAVADRRTRRRRAGLAVDGAPLETRERSG